MLIKPIKTGLIKPGQDILEVFLRSLKKEHLENGDILVISSKIIALSQGRVVNLKRVTVTKKSSILAKKYAIPPTYAALILKEADLILGGVKYAILTLKDRILIANAGIDRSNVKSGHAVLWPVQRERYLDSLKKALQGHFKAKIGLIMADSHCLPLRLGVSAIALAIAGFEGISDERGKADLYQNKLVISRQNLADELASAAASVMGERDQLTPFVLIKKAPVKMSERSSRILTRSLYMRPSSCLFRDYHIKY